MHDHAKHQPDSQAIVSDDGEVSYSDLSSLIKQASAALADFDIRKGDVICVMAYKNIQTIQVMLGAQQLGVIVVPINPQLKPLQIAHIFNDSNATSLFCNQSTLVNLIENDYPLVELKRIVVIDVEQDRIEQQLSNIQMIGWNSFSSHRASEKIVSNNAIDPQDPAFLIYTSGSTGKPKGVVFTFDNVKYGAMSISAYLKNTCEDRILALMPFSFDYGLSQLTSAMYTGATLILFDYLFPKGVVESALRHRATGIPAVPHVWSQLANLAWPEVSDLRYVTSTGGRLHEDTIKKLQSCLPTTDIYSMYGFTEAFRATYLPPEQLSIRPRSIGRAVPHASILVVDEDGQSVEAGQIGELIQSGPLVSAGYWNNQEANEEKFRSRKNTKEPDLTKYAWSGDLAYFDDEGYFYYVSRMDDQVKLSGYRVSPNEIEQAISNYELIDEVSVICERSNLGELEAIAFITTAPLFEVDHLSNWCKRNLPRYMIPARFIELDSLPLNPNKKIDKLALNLYLKQGT